MNVARSKFSDDVLSSSPAFGTPLHPVNLQRQAKPPPPLFRSAAANSAPILPVLIPPPSLRPLAFRIFTKKHNLTISASSLSAFATFIGRHCGSSWREDGTGEKVLEEVAKLWKKENGGVIVEDGTLLKGVLKALEGFMSGGRLQSSKSTGGLSRVNTFDFSENGTDAMHGKPPTLQRAGSSFGLSSLAVSNETEEEDNDDCIKSPSAWFKVVSAFDQPRLVFDNDKKHFVHDQSPASAFPSIKAKATLFRERYSQIYHRLLRNPAFQAPSVAARTQGLVRQTTGISNQQFYRITLITNLLGRGGTTHLLLGMLSLTPAGMLAIQDTSGSITLDLSNATPLQGKDSAYFVPGMIVLVDGLYEESWVGAGSTGLGNTGGVGGMIGGRFVGFGIGGPPVEKRDLSLGINLTVGDASGGLGWMDFLGQGSDKAVGDKMRKLEAQIMAPDGSDLSSNVASKAVIIGEVDLEDPSTIPALRAVLSAYAAEEQPPTAFILTGNFTSKSALSGTGCGSIEYKVLFDSLAALMVEYPNLLRSSTWTFIPGDRDAWASAFSSGASAMVPKEAVPDIFTSRIKRAFATAKSEAAQAGIRHEEGGDAIWTTNPARISLFGPAHEIVVFRDDISGRLRRNAINIGSGLKELHDSPMRPDGEADQDIVMSGAVPDSAEAQMTEGEGEGEESMPAITADTDEEADFAKSQARKLVLSLLPQSHLSPFPSTIRPTHWSYQSSLSLYPLPHTLVLVDAQAKPFAVTFEGCHVVNPGRLVGQGSRRRKAVWAEYDLWTKRGKICDTWIR